MQEASKLIDARKLKEILSNKEEFYRWIQRNIKRYKLTENEDFIIEKEIVKTSVNKTKKVNCLFSTEATKKIIFGCRKNIIADRIEEALAKGKELTNILEEEKKLKIEIIELNDEEFPKQLKKIKNPPKQLYIKGDIQNLKEYGIAVIGTRESTNYGRKITKNFTTNLVGYNINIISGLALGIDGCAHRACIEAKGKTIAVLPSGFDNIYPKENELLLNKILESGGTVITEYPPDFEKTPESCRARNRIISGLAIGTLVIEAGIYSGTSITARYTREQGKKVFCIPSNLSNKKGIGTNKMIKENQAKLVTDVEDIIKEFPELKLEKRIGFDFVKLGDKKKPKEKPQSEKRKFEITEENQEIYNFLTKEPKSIDEIVQGLNKQTSEVIYKLSLLELEGAIEELSGKRFKLK